MVSDSSDATNKGDSLTGRGKVAIMGEVFRRGMLEEEPSDIPVKEEINCDRGNENV